jgi:hypothetical protein
MMCNGVDVFSIEKYLPIYRKTSFNVSQRRGGCEYKLRKILNGGNLKLRLLACNH